MRICSHGALLLALVLSPTVVSAQQPRPIAGQDPLNRAAAAERRGADAEASALYQSVLGNQPAQLPALLGAERVLQNLGRSAQMLPIVQRAVAVDSTSIGVLSVAVRTYARVGRADSALRYASKWAAVSAGDESPWREWSDAALEGRDVASAKRALEEGRRRLGTGVLGAELAQVLQVEGDYAGAATQWLTVLATTPTYRNGALILLGQAPPAQRGAVREAMLRVGTADARRLLALLQARWGEAEQALAQLRPLLPANREQAIALLRGLLEELRNRSDPVALRVRGAALEAIADRESGTAAVRTRLDAARAYADGGAEGEARRLLAAVAADSNAPAGAATGASVTLLGVLIAEGKAAEAEGVLASLAPSMDMDGRDKERRRIALAWAKRGDFDRADALVAGDSSVAGFDMRGRLRLYRGDLANATLLLKEAGPFDEDREHSVARVTILALLQAVATESLPALGHALLDLERGDSAKALVAFIALADSLPPPGAAEVRLVAGRLAGARGNVAAARLLLQAADTAAAPATAPAARYALAVIEAEAGERAKAAVLLESLLLEFPESAVAPEARRLRDAVRRATSTPGAT
jgi:tetratricopeptide (TPR) repeat protein